MLSDFLCLIRGGGDLGTGVALQLKRIGMPVVVCDLKNPLAVRRKVSLSSAILDKKIEIEEITGERVDDLSTINDLSSTQVVPVIISDSLPTFPISVLVDARMQKKSMDTKIDDASLVIALGPGFFAGRDCHVVIETMRGPNMGKVIWDGCAEEDTGIPGEVGGLTSERLLRSPSNGEISWVKQIGDLVEKDEGSHHAAADGGQGATNFEPAEIAGARHDNGVNRVAGGRVSGDRFRSVNPAHRLSSNKYL